MKTLYQTQFIYIGHSAIEALKDNMLITFKKGVPEELADYCYVHTHSELLDALRIGDLVTLGEESYQITAIGEVANKNLKELGHVTWRFDGATEAEYPGSIHLQGTAPQSIALNSLLIIKRDEK